jgi:hypothetical protein
VFALFGSLFLERSCGAQRGVEGQVVGLAIGRASLDIAPALALGVRAAATPAIAARDMVERVLDFARQESRPDLDLLAAIPPVGRKLVEDILPGRLGGRLFRFFVG